MSHDPQHPSLQVVAAEPARVRALQDQHRREINCQFVLHSWLARGWCNAYLLSSCGKEVGYGLVSGAHGVSRDTVTEFHVIPEHREAAAHLFCRLVAVSGARSIQAQTNDQLLRRMLEETATCVENPSILFRDGGPASLRPRGTVFRRVTEEDLSRMFRHGVEPVGEWALDVNGRVVATGGILTHYNEPFADLFMEVDEGFRRRGYGGFLVQELRRECRNMGRVPAARCRTTNEASRATLRRAGMEECGRVLVGEIAR